MAQTLLFCPQEVDGEQEAGGLSREEFPALARDRIITETPM
jgi:hypothetical protein